MHAGDLDREEGERRGPATRGGRAWMLAAVAFVGFGLLLLVRGPLTHPWAGRDFANFHVASRAWLEGENPYQHEALQRTWDRTPQATPRRWQRNEVVALYPPSMFPLMSPFAAAPYKVAAVGWTLLNAALVLVLIGLTLQLAGRRLRSPEGLALAAGVLALAPLQTGFRVGQMALVVVCLVLAAIVLARRRRRSAGGVALGLATALKPQIGLVFLAYMVIRGRWAAAGVATAVAAGCYGLGAAVLTAQGHDWWSGLSDNLHYFAHGGPGDPTPANATSWQLINLHHPLHQFTDNRALVQALTWGITIVLGLLAWRWATPARPQRERLFLAVISVLSLVVAYHRIYDAALLVVPLAYLASAAGRWRWNEWTAVLLLLPFVVSGPAVLSHLARLGWVPVEWQASAVWRMVLLPHQAWALLAVAVVLAWRLATMRRTARPEAGG